MGCPKCHSHKNGMFSSISGIGWLHTLLWDLIRYEAIEGATLLIIARGVNGWGGGGEGFARKMGYYSLIHITAHNMAWHFHLSSCLSIASIFFYNLVWNWEYFTGYDNPGLKLQWDKKNNATMGYFHRISTNAGRYR